MWQIANTSLHFIAWWFGKQLALYVNWLYDVFWYCVKPDRSYNIVTHHPPVSYYLCMAAGLKKGAMKPGK